MNILYVSSLCSKTKYSELFANSKNLPGMQAQKYNRLMAEGLVQNNGVTVHAISAPPVSRSTSRKMYFKTASEEASNATNGIKFSYVPFFNLPILKHISLIFNSYNICKKQIKLSKSSTNDDCAVVCDALSLCASYGALKAAKKYGVKSVGLITDLPDYLKSGESGLFQKLYKKVIEMCGSFVLMTKQMNEKINPQGKPYAVIEGQADISMHKKENLLADKFDKKICIYAGGIEEEYGLKILAEGFAAACEGGELADCELLIYGSGGYLAKLLEFCKVHPSVKYEGLKLNDEIIAAELKATILVNPRPSSGEFTKYSFPSKNLEYMASGTPLLATKLPCMPDEYLDYIYVIEDETADGICKAFKEVLGKSREDLHQKGADAKEFVLKYKNNKTQAGKVLDLLK